MRAQSNVTLEPESPLALFIDECKGAPVAHCSGPAHSPAPTDKTPQERAKLLETTPLFANIHSEAASAGQTAVPDISEDVDLHFTCFVQAPSPPAREDQIEAEDGARRLVELDGRRGGPVDRGVCTDLLADAAAYIRDHFVKDATSVNFSMLALAPPAEF